MAELKLNNVSKNFGRLAVLKNIALEINDREFFVIIGPSGCGKSTLLRILAGLEQVSSGNLLIDGRDVTSLPPGQRDLAMVFQSYALMPHLTAFENISFGLRIRRVPASEITRLVNEVAGVLELTPYLHKRPAQLSGGQCQRVALGRALVRHPAAFLFDEPLSNLDARLRGDMRAELLRLHDLFPTTSVYVTHDQIEAMTLGDRICVLKDGEIQQIGAANEVYNRPDNMFVAGFFGAPPMNFIPGIFHAGETTCRLSIDSGTTVDLAGAFHPIPDHPTNGLPVSIGLRPETLKIVSTPEKGKLRIDGVVEIVELTGADCHIHFRLNDGKFIARVPATNPPAPGGKVCFMADPADLHLFNQAGRRIKSNQED